MNAPLKALEGSRGRPSGAKGASDLPSLMRQIAISTYGCAVITKLVAAGSAGRS